ncbi:uncharacterized protein Dvar_67090 [Desulfosarcina variabilis str. Montpellier]|uniref:hypothetical protein n=1 Tax=Desulfosarcina variabilis TaxID=2300 RepID=UPI003AFB262D
MLQHTFIHIPGVGPKTEQGVWAAGVKDWASFFDGMPLKLPRSKKDRIAAELSESRRQLDAGNAHSIFSPPENPFQVHRPTISRYCGEVAFIRSLQPQW